MNDLAITEKKPQRSGGCVGIFFQLFDWNRRLAKKKLFSKKLLPPARAKKASQKFGADDKLPMAKLLLIADENRGGFPKKSENDNIGSSSSNAHEMKSPGLVARLMGLESMPAVRRGKPKKALLPEKHEKKFENNESVGNYVENVGCSQEEFQFEKGHAKIDSRESRPQKLQKTGMFERRAVTRFGAESLQFKSVLSRSRKHHPKLGSPVKSPRVGRNSTRLMEVASKILEPGRHATQRAKCALTYAPSLDLRHENGDMREGFDQFDTSSYYASSSKVVKGQHSCKSCGNWLDVVDRRTNFDEKMPVRVESTSGNGIISPPGTGKSKMKSAVSSLEQKRNVVAPISQERFVSFRAESKANIEKRSKKFIERKPEFRENQEYSLSTQKSKPLKDIASVSTPKQRTPRPSHMPLAKDTATPSPKFVNVKCQRDLFNVGSVNGGKDFVASNRNSTCKTKPRIPSKIIDNAKNDTERNAWDKRDDSTSRMGASPRKRRPTNGTAQIEYSKLNQPQSRKQRDVEGDVIIGKVVGSSGYSKNQNSVKTELSRQTLLRDTKGDAAGGRKNADVISFTFSSPMKHNTEYSSPAAEKTWDRDEFDGVSLNKKLTTDSSNRKASSRLASQLRGDALGALLEEKLRELTCEDRDDLEAGEMGGKSTATILEELICALTAERSPSQEDGDNSSVGFNEEDNLCHVSQNRSNDISSHRQMLDANKKLQGEGKACGLVVGYPHASAREQPSPECVLDASFSNDSCFSESLDASSGYKLHPESMECSYELEESPELDGDLSDCATSFSTGMTQIDKTKYSLNNISSALYGIDPADMGLVGSDLNHAWEVIANTDLLIGSLYGGRGLVNLSVGSLLEKLGILSDAPWSSPNCSMGLTKVGNQLGRFLFDCIIECFDSKYGDYCRSRFTAWPKLQLQISGELLIQDVQEEVRKWVDLAGKTADEIVESEMSHSFRMWTDCEVEVFESGNEIEWDILQALVDEVVIDLEQCWNAIIC